MSAAEMRALAHEIFQAVDRGGWEAASRYAAEGLTARISGVPGIMSREAFGRAIDMLRGAFPDLRHEIVDAIVEGDRVAVRLVVRGTHTGALRSAAGEIPPTGRKFELRSLAVLRHADEKCVEQHIVFDNLDLLRQLGVAGTPGAEAANAATLRAVYRAYNERDFERASDLVTEDYRGYSVPLGLFFEGRAGYRSHLEGWVAAFPDSIVEIVRLASSEQGGVVEFVGHGTHTGPLQTTAGEIAPTGRTVVLQCCDVYRMLDGKMAEARSYFDSVILLRQLGVGQGIPGGTPGMPPVRAS